MNRTIQSVSNPAFVSNFSLVYFDDSKRGELMNMSFRVLKDVNKAVVWTSIKAQNSNKRNEYDREIFKGQIDVCKASQGIIGNFITKLVSDNLAEHSNFRFKCPTKAGFYYFSNFPTITENALPPFMLKQVFENFVFFLKIQGKVPNNKQTVLLLSISISGVFQDE